MLLTWTLVFYLSGYKAGGPSVIDGFASEAGCRAAAIQLKATFTSQYAGGACIKVDHPKVATK